MTTAATIIEDAFDSLTIKTSETDLTASELALAVRLLNRMITTWAQSGLEMGFTKIAATTDPMTVPDWAEEAIVSQLAIRLAPAFDVDVPIALGQFASSSLSKLRLHLQHDGEAQFPTTLPMGAGNNNTTSGSTFFTDETGGDLTRDNDITLADNESIDISVD